MENTLQNEFQRPQHPQKSILMYILKGCKTLLKKINKKIEKQEVELSEYKQSIIYQQIGDSLLADHSVVTKGSSEIAIINIHSQEIQTIKINPKLAAIQNAELYYKRAKKGKRGLEQCQTQLNLSKNEFKEIENLTSEVNLCIGCLEKDPEDTQKRIDSVLKKAEKYKIYVDIPYENKHVKPEEKVPYRHVTIDGWDIYIGKNDAQNDELTTKFAKPWDLWFHVAIHSGSHVIIKMERNGPRPPNAVIEKVAALTVWFSKAKHTSLSEVHMTEARFVRKPRKYPPGKVIVERCKAIRVSPISPQAMFRDYKEEAE